MWGRVTCSTLHSRRLCGTMSNSAREMQEAKVTRGFCNPNCSTPGRETAVASITTKPAPDMPSDKRGCICHAEAQLSLPCTGTSGHGDPVPKGYRTEVKGREKRSCGHHRSLALGDGLAAPEDRKPRPKTNRTRLGNHNPFHIREQMTGKSTFLQRRHRFARSRSQFSDGSARDRCPSGPKHVLRGLVEPHTVQRNSTRSREICASAMQPRISIPIIFFGCAPHDTEFRPYREI